MKVIVIIENNESLRFKKLIQKPLIRIIIIGLKKNMKRLKLYLFFNISPKAMIIKEYETACKRGRTNKYS